MDNNVFLNNLTWVRDCRKADVQKLQRCRKCGQKERVITSGGRSRAADRTLLESNLHHGPHPLLASKPPLQVFRCTHGTITNSMIFGYNSWLFTVIISIYKSDKVLTNKITIQTNANHKCKPSNRRAFLKFWQYEDFLKV